MLSNIVTYDINITSEDFINKKTDTKDKWNQLYLLSMESVLGANCCIPLIHMSNRKIYIEITNEGINEFSFAYMCNPTLYRHKVFKEQVKLCLNNTFGVDTKKQINVILKRPNTRVIAFIINYEHGSYSPRKMFKMLSCVVYTIIYKYVCIDYLCTENKRISELKIGNSLISRHEDKDYKNLFSIGIPDIFMNMLLCQGFINNNDSIVILKCPNRMSQ